MDLKVMIKEMIQSGASDEEILQNLRDLGIQDVETALAETLKEEAKTAPKPSTVKPPAREPEEILPPSQISAERVARASYAPRVTEKNEGEERGNSLFGDAGPQEAQGTEKEEPLDELEQAGDGMEPESEPTEAEPMGNSLFGDVQKPSPKEVRKAQAATDEIPDLEITSVGLGGEKKTSIEEMLGKPLMQNLPQSSLQDTTHLEAKLDEAIALLKSVQEINQKILEANRDVLLRLKMQK